MGSWVLLGFVLFGVLSIALGFFFRAWRQSSDSPSSRRSHRPTSITDSIPVKHFQETPPLTNRSGFGQSLRNAAADGAERFRRYKPKKSAGDRSTPKPAQQVNPANEQWWITSAQKVNPAFKQTKIRSHRRPQSIDGHPGGIPPQPINPTWNILLI